MAVERLQKSKLRGSSKQPSSIRARKTGRGGVEDCVPQDTQTLLMKLQLPRKQLKIDMGCCGGALSPDPLTSRCPKAVCLLVSKP